jgi:hypothetical protein
MQKDNIEGKRLVDLGTRLEVRASGGRSKMRLVHYPSKH